PRPPVSTLFPYTTLFRSPLAVAEGEHRVGLGRLVFREVRAIARSGEGFGDAPAAGFLARLQGLLLRLHQRQRGGLAGGVGIAPEDRKSTRLNSSHSQISY